MLSSFYQYFSGSAAPPPPPTTDDAPATEKRPTVDSPDSPQSTAASPATPSCATSPAKDLVRLLDEAWSLDGAASGVMNGGAVGVGGSSGSAGDEVHLCDETKAAQVARNTIERCQIGRLIEETKLLMDTTLEEPNKVGP